MRDVGFEGESDHSQIAKVQGECIFQPSYRHLRECKALRRKMQLADDFADHLSHPPESLVWRKAYEVIMERYEEATTFWEPRLEANHSLQPDIGDTCLSTTEVDDLWKFAFQSTEGRPIPRYTSTPKPNSSFTGRAVVELAWCTCCSKCSAAMKKCSRCGNARYCNANW
jgi:hypothetical protein